MSFKIKNTFEKKKNPNKVYSKNLVLTLINQLLVLTIIILVSSKVSLATENYTLSWNLTSTLEYGTQSRIFLAFNSTNPFNGTINLISSQGLTTNPSLFLFQEQNFTNLSGIYNGTYNGTYGGIYNILIEFNITSSALGSHILIANLSNNSNPLLLLSNYTLVVDTTAPIVTSQEIIPIAAPNNPVTLALNTSENATCKFSNNDTTYDNMFDGFSVTGSTYHLKTLIGLIGSYTFYARCTDLYNNKMLNSSIFSFTVQDSVPTAKIVLDNPSPIKAGTFQVTLIASKNLQPTPMLQYGFSSAPTALYEVPLAGSNNIWSGYITINPQDDGKIGVFHFLGYDLSGNNGSYITEGKIFVVDNTKPIAPLNIGIVRNSNNDVELEWYYDGEQIDYFKIYKKIESGVDYIDTFATTKNSYYLDTTTLKNNSYYYKVSAVDKAGNNGALSAEVNVLPLVEEIDTVPQIITEQQNQQVSINQQDNFTSTQQQSVNSPSLLQEDTKIETLSKSLLGQIRTLTVELDWAVNNLQRNDDPEAQKIIDISNLILKSNDARAQLADIENNIQEIRTSSLENEEKLNKLESLQLTLKKIEKTSPKNARIVGKSEFVQLNFGNETDEVAKLFYFNGDETTVKDYQKAVSLFQKNVEVITTITQVLIENIDRSYSNKTFIRKTISYKSPDTVNNVELTEIIPKNIAQVSDEIEIKTANSQILQSDPIIQWGISQFNYENNVIEYSIDKYISRQEAEQIKTVVLLDKSNFKSTLPPSLVGNVVKTLDDSGFGSTWRILLWLGFITFILVLVYYVIYVKGEEARESKILVNQEEQKGIQHFSYASQLLLEAKQALDKDQIDRAKVIYDELSGIYKNLPDDAKKILLPKCVNLHSKIEKTIKNNQNKFK